MRQSGVVSAFVALLILSSFIAPATAQTATQTPTDTPDNIEDEPQGFLEWFDNYFFFVAAIVGAIGIMGALGSKSMAIGGMSAYLVFAHIALETSTPLFENILYVTLVLVIIGTAWKLWRLEGGGET
jgi:hypothetical protein